ncbi:MAG: putative membrane protein [Candidatus Methanohalarchaeum thermophilum]|uniref:Membrane protein n=1 Tax=Methanohalarchaeum thermophilum TaxID=1903181 RepID=A0A1Q6DXR4_METT1|nr:MAG: putative membrane protein [Candidatus Methanohalarchaeum thermophilum]
MLDKLIEFINKYYINPIVQDSGYNPVNTLTWGILLVLCFFGIIKLLDTLDIKVNRKFVFSLIPFIFVGSTFRVFEDAGIFSPPVKYLFITPLIYFLIAGIVISILLAKYLIRKTETDLKTTKMLFITGSAIAILNLAILTSWGINNPGTNPLVPLKIIGTAIAVFSPIAATLLYYKKSFISDNIYITILGCHIFDASSTYIGYQLGAKEKHVLPSLLIEWSGQPAIMFPLKLTVIILSIYLIEKTFLKEDEFKVLLYLVLIVLGLAPALRNTLRLTLGV